MNTFGGLPEFDKNCGSFPYNFMLSGNNKNGSFEISPNSKRFVNDNRQTSNNIGHLPAHFPSSSL